MNAKFYRDFAHVATSEIERMTYTLLGDKYTSPTVGLAQVARDYANAPVRPWHWHAVEEAAASGACSATITTCTDRIIVDGRDRDRVLMIAVLLAFGVDEDFLL